MVDSDFRSVSPNKRRGLSFLYHCWILSALRLYHALISELFEDGFSRLAFDGRLIRSLKWLELPNSARAKWSHLLPSARPLLTPLRLMAPSRGKPPAKSLPKPSGFQSKSTPNLPTLRSLQAADSKRADAHSTQRTTLHPGAAASPEIITSPSGPASLDDFSLGPSSASEEEEDGELSSLPSRPFTSHGHSRSHTYLAPSAFAPPFYNRPPTPLPPSPSLTSLLRPRSSRPTTPDPSSDENTPTTQNGNTGTQTPNSAAASTLTSTFRSAKPVARASPKVPTYEYYGFTLYLTSSLVFLGYCLWSFLPSPFLHQLGIYYFPDRWWALAIPAWTVMFVVYIYVALACYNTGYLTLKLGDVSCLVDEAANVAVVDAQGNIIRDDKISWPSDRDDKRVGKKGRGRHGGRSRQSSYTKAHGNAELDWKTLWKEGTDAVMDIPIGGVCEILYGQDDEEGGDEND